MPVVFTDAKCEFELQGFRVFHPSEYERIVEFVKEKHKDLHVDIEELTRIIKEVLAIVAIKAQVWGRLKSYYSIWKKETKYASEGVKREEGKRFNDLLAFTVMVDDVDQCYAVASALQSYADVSTQDFEDYIQNPKANGFSELQLTCRFPEMPTMNVEVQILTSEMYWYNTYGPASHIAYKASGKRYAEKNTEFQWVEMIHREIQKSKEMQELAVSRPLRLNLFSKSVFVFTPKFQLDSTWSCHVPMKGKL